MMQPIWVIIPAAGVGQRMNADCPKQYIDLVGQTILDRTLATFIEHPMIEGVAVGLGEQDGYWPQSKWCEHPKVLTFEGGQERADTVLKGLQCLQRTHQIDDRSVLVHDAARPLLTDQALQRIVIHESAQGAILALPARDTVKQSVDTRVATTLDRQVVWFAQTPQKFPADALRMALLQAQQAQVTVTDECSAMEFIGWQPDLVLGESINFKVTFPEDLLMAQALILHRAHPPS